MDFQNELLKGNTKEVFDSILTYVGNNNDRFELLVELILTDNQLIASRASNSLSKCIETYPELSINHLKAFTLILEQNKNTTIRRNIIRSFQFIQIPEELAGRVADCCFRFLMDRSEATAIRILSMTVLHNISELFPELKQELQFIIEENMPYGSAGFVSRGKKILKKLENG